MVPPTPRVPSELRRFVSHGGRPPRDPEVRAAWVARLRLELVAHAVAAGSCAVLVLGALLGSVDGLVAAAAAAAGAGLVVHGLRVRRAIARLRSTT